MVFAWTSRVTITRISKVKGGPSTCIILAGYCGFTWICAKGHRWVGTQSQTYVPKLDDVYTLDLPPTQKQWQMKGKEGIPNIKSNSPGGDWHPGWGIDPMYTVTVETSEKSTTSLSQSNIIIYGHGAMFQSQEHGQHMFSGVCHTHLISNPKKMGETLNHQGSHLLPGNL